MVEVKETFFVAPEVEQIEPWRCGLCRALIYNTDLVDGQVVPAPGAPEATFASSDYPRTCKLCSQMIEVLERHDHPYFRMLEQDQKREMERLKKSG